MESNYNELKTSWDENHFLSLTTNNLTQFSGNFDDFYGMKNYYLYFDIK